MSAGIFTFKLLTPATFPDFERLFAPVKGCSGCWCMYYRLEPKEWRELQGDGCREAMRGLVERGEAWGLLAYAEGEPVGWCTFGPRHHFPRLDRTKICQGLDNPDGLWSLPCFFIARLWRGKGLSRLLLAEGTRGDALPISRRRREGRGQQAVNVPWRASRAPGRARAGRGNREPWSGGQGNGRLPRAVTQHG